MAPKKSTDAAAPAGERRTSSRLAGKPSAPAPAAAAPASAGSKRSASTAAAANGTKDEPAAAAPKKAKSDAAPAAASSGGGGGGKLKVGDPLPDLTLQDQEGKEIKIAEIKKAVIFAYPKANTPGCTTQGQCFRDAYEEYTKAGYKVYGLSNDNPTPLKNWKTKQGFQYDLISDPKRDLIGKLTGSKSSTTRSHFVVDADGKVALSDVGVKPKESSEAVLSFVKSKI